MNNPPLEISDEARKAASEIFRRDNDISSDKFSQEHFDSLASVVQLAINSARAADKEKIAKLEATLKSGIELAKLVDKEVRQLLMEKGLVIEAGTIHAECFKFLTKAQEALEAKL